MFLATRHNLFLWTGLFIALPGVLLAPTKGPKCTKPAIRREWRTLPPSQQDAFHKAVKCLQTKPSRIQSGGVSKTLYDDYTYIHLQLEPLIHQVAALYPWHRYFNSLREKDMQACGYTQPHPYWDWTRDAASASAFRNASIFDPIHGFGSHSAPEGNTTVVCVDNGPYAGFQLNVPEPHCLGRGFTVTDEMVGNWTSSTVSQILEYPDFVNFWNTSERQPHNLIHFAIGGDVFEKYSPNDPIFFLHHAQFDRLWTLWQGRNATRLSDYQGNTIQNTTVFNATLQDTLDFMGLGDNRSVESVMDTLSNGLCYKYDDDE
ncbi:Common central domain of tyrosinase [Rhizoctonia solani]|uniref:Common central domain of tyrosinase n=1 Tax=Rhizoctonia solani TaxID=456999 RepID=A0A8H7H1R4_9AGAM|nr:Common central domain of tyrosinase [Rhizoctonia solani]